VVNGDSVVPHQNFFNHEPHDALAFNDIKRFSGTTQPSEKCCEGLGQAQECNLIGALVSDRLQLSTKRLLALTQQGHSIAQLFNRQESFLVGVE
jgi:hypothetical protein